MLKALTLSDFTPFIGSSFQVIIESNVSIVLELLKAEKIGSTPSSSLPHRPNPATRESFSLLFRGPTDMVLPQRIYLINHPQLGDLSIFMVPISRDVDGVKYEAIFN